MSEIDFQNGFICGMATRGLTKSITQINESEPLPFARSVMRMASFIDLHLRVCTIIEISEE